MLKKKIGIQTKDDGSWLGSLGQEELLVVFSWFLLFFIFFS